MKKYSPDALEIICEYFEDVESYYPDILDKSKEELIASYRYECLTEAAAEMMLGPYDDCSYMCNDPGRDHSLQYHFYQRIRPYAKALGIRLAKGYARICDEGDCLADCAIDEMVELVTDALLQGIKDNWEYLASDEW